MINMKFLVLGAVITSSLWSGSANAQETVRIGLATQTWYPSVVAETAQQQGFFADEGLSAELTVYQSGGETFTSLAAGAADVISIQPSIVATGRSRGIEAKMIAQGSDANYGWQLIVPTGSDIEEIADLEGANVGITTSGSLSDFLAQWTMSEKDVSFNPVPLGGGGLVPNLISGNVAAAVIYSPLSFQVMQAGEGQSLIDYGSEIPAHLNSGWAASDAFISESPDVVERTLRALYKGVDYLQSNPDEAIQILMNLNQIEEDVAAQEYQEQFQRLSVDGSMTVEGAQAANDLAEIGGMTDLAPAEDVIDSSFTPITLGN